MHDVTITLTDEEYAHAQKLAPWVGEQYDAAQTNPATWVQAVIARRVKRDLYPRSEADRGGAP